MKNELKKVLTPTNEQQRTLRIISPSRENSEARARVIRGAKLLKNWSLTATFFLLARALARKAPTAIYTSIIRTSIIKFEPSASSSPPLPAVIWRVISVYAERKLEREREGQASEPTAQQP